MAASHKPPCQSHKARYLLYFCVCVLGLICNPPSFSSPEEIERNRNEAVIKLQTLWRGHRESQRFDCLLTAVVVTPSSTPPISLPPGRTRANNFFSEQRLQTEIRARVAARQFTALCESTVLIQRRWRSVLQARQCRKAYLNLKKATHIVQTKRRAALKSTEQRGIFPFLFYLFL